METTMELDELKAAWQTLDRRLDQHDRINLLLLTEQRVAKARSRLRPLFFGQIVQIVSGILMIAIGVSVWDSSREMPSMFISGLIVHLSGVVTIIIAGITLGMIAGINDTAPVLEIQKRLARLRTFYIRGGMAVGLSWWLFWIPFIAVLFYWLSGVNILERTPSIAMIGIPFGVVGLIATWFFHRWAHNPKRPRLAKFLDNSMTGSSLRKARAELDILNEFERD